MSFEAHRLKGRISTLLMVLLPILIGISFGFMSLLGYSPSTNPYISLVFVIPNYAVYILFLVAMNGFAKYYDEPKIFKNSLYAFIVSITGGIASFIGTITFVTPILDQLSTYITGPGNFPPISVILSMLQAFLIVWAIVSIIGILNGFFYRRAFYALAEKSGENNFKQAGLFMFIGGMLIIIGIGGLIYFIGLIFAILGFFSITPKSSQTH